MNTTKIINEIIKTKNNIFFIICILIKPFINNFNVFAAAYAYMRWLDDIVDNISNNESTINNFLVHQRKLINNLYNGKNITTQIEQEKLLIDFINYDISIGCQLKEDFLIMLETLFFDLNRRHKICTKFEIEEYSYRMAKSFSSFILHFLNGENVKEKEEIITLASYGCQAYMLRDLAEDIKNGLINIDKETIDKYGINIKEPHCDQILIWIRKKANHLNCKMKLIDKIIKGKISFRNKLILLLFIEPRRYVVWKIVKKNVNPLEEGFCSKIDCIRIAFNIFRLLVPWSKIHASV
jgi:hypothetical protein